MHANGHAKGSAVQSRDTYHNGGGNLLRVFGKFGAHHVCGQRNVVEEAFHHVLAVGVELFGPLDLGWDEHTGLENELAPVVGTLGDPFVVQLVQSLNVCFLVLQRRELFGTADDLGKHLGVELVLWFEKADDLVISRLHDVVVAVFDRGRVVGTHTNGDHDHEDEEVDNQDGSVVVLRHEERRQSDRDLHLLFAVGVAKLFKVLARLLVRQCIVGFGHQHELVRCLLVIGVLVRVVDQTQFAVSSVDITFRRIDLDTQNLEWIELFDVPVHIQQCSRRVGYGRSSRVLGQVVAQVLTWTMDVDVWMREVCCRWDVLHD